MRLRILFDATQTLKNCSCMQLSKEACNLNQIELRTPFRIFVNLNIYITQLYIVQCTLCDVNIEHIVQCTMCMLYNAHCVM